jgi:hypothetical protein
MVIIFAVVIFAFGGVFAYEYYFIPKTQTLNIVVPTKVQILTSTLPITTIEKQNLSDSNHNSEHVYSDSIIIKGKDISDSSIEFTKNITLPGFRNLNINILNNINQLLGFKNITGCDSLDDVRCTVKTSFRGLTDVDYQINYDKNNLLSISLTTTYLGLYQSENTHNYLINLMNGEVVKPTDIFYQNKISDLLNILNVKLQSNIQQELDFAKKENPSGQGDMCSEETINQRLQSEKKDDPNYGKFMEQNLIASNDLNRKIPQYTNLIIMPNGIEFIYDFMFAHAIQACQPDGVIVLSYTQLKDYIRPDGLLGSELK